MFSYVYCVDVCELIKLYGCSGLQTVRTLFFVNCVDVKICRLHRR